MIARLNAAKNSDGEYPFILSEETGAGLEYDALGSAWCLAAAALYAQLTGDRSGLAEMERTEAHYYNAFIARAECYGGPLDTDKAVDSEGVLAYIRAVRRLHALTRRTVYLNHLQDALGLRQHSGRFDRPVLGRTLTPAGLAQPPPFRYNTIIRQTQPCADVCGARLCFAIRLIRPRR